MPRHETSVTTERETARDADLRSSACGECGTEEASTGTAYSLVSQKWRLARPRPALDASPCPGCGEATKGTAGA